MIVTITMSMEMFVHATHFFRNFRFSLHQKFTSTANAKVLKIEPDCTNSQLYSSLLHIYIVNNNFEHTTQYGRTPAFIILKSNYESPFLELNIRRMHELLSGDAVNSDTPNINDRANSDQIFFGKYTLLTDVHRMKSYKKLASKLSEIIR